MTLDPSNQDTEGERVAEVLDTPRVERSERFQAIGERLRREREAQSLNPTDVAKALNLPAHLLDDLESGRMERLAPLYRRGYINNYAALLGLDSDSLLDHLDPEEPPRLTEVLPVKRPRFVFEKYMKLATYLVVTIAIVPPLVYIYLNTGANLFSGQEEAGDLAVAETLETELPPQQTVRTLDLDEQAVPESTNRPVSASALPLTAIRPLGTPQAVETEPSVELETPEAIAEVTEFELTVRLTEDSWVEITAADDTRLEYDLLRADQERVYRGLPPFRVLLGRASAVELELDGGRLTYDGHDRGDVAQLFIDGDGAVLR